MPVIETAGSPLHPAPPFDSGPDAFAGVDFNELERSLRRPRTLMNVLLTWVVAGMTLVALVPLFSVLWLLVWRGGKRLSLALFTQLPPVPMEAGSLHIQYPI